MQVREDREEFYSFFWTRISQPVSIQTKTAKATELEPTWKTTMPIFLEELEYTYQRV